MPTYQKDPPPIQFDTSQFLAPSFVKMIRLPDDEWTPGAGETEDDRPLHTYVQIRAIDANGYAEQAAYRIEDVFPGQVAEMHGHALAAIEHMLQQKGYTQT